MPGYGDLSVTLLYMTVLPIGQNFKAAKHKSVQWNFAKQNGRKVSELFFSCVIHIQAQIISCSVQSTDLPIFIAVLQYSISAGLESF
jgi:hypothetical protein